MKANELMIGDWVKPFGSQEGVYAKITSITPSRVNMVTTSGNYHHETADYIYPIPLTTKILEKNGFVYNDMPFINGWEQFGLTLYHGGDGFLVNCGQNVSLKLKYFHELQHALRLCGIEKEIEL